MNNIKVNNIDLVKKLLNETTDEQIKILANGIIEIYEKPKLDNLPDLIEAIILYKISKYKRQKAILIQYHLENVVHEIVLNLDYFKELQQFESHIKVYICRAIRQMNKENRKVLINFINKNKLTYKRIGYPGFFASIFVNEIITIMKKIGFSIAAAKIIDGKVLLTLIINLIEGFNKKLVSEIVWEEVAELFENIIDANEIFDIEKIR